MDFGTDSLSTPSLNFFEELCADAREPGAAVSQFAMPCGDFQRGRLDLRPTNMRVWVHILRSVDMGHSPDFISIFIIFLKKRVSNFPPVVTTYLV